MAHQAAQIIGYGVGYMVGGPWGAAIGAAVMGALVPPPPTVVEGPRLEDMRLQGAGAGRPIPKIFGSVRTAGSLIAAATLREERVETEQSAKGGPSAVQVTYNYYGTFALAICEGPIMGVRRIWCDSDLYWDGSGNGPATEDGDVFSAIPDSDGAYQLTDKIKLYVGNETQNPDPTLEAFLGAGKVPAFRGTAYIVFNDWPLSKFGNRVPNIEFEVLTAGSVQTKTVRLFSKPFDALTKSEPLYDPVADEVFWLVKGSTGWFDLVQTDTGYKATDITSEAGLPGFTAGYISISSSFPVAYQSREDRFYIGGRTDVAFPNGEALVVSYNRRKHKFVTAVRVGAYDRTNTFLGSFDGPAYVTHLCAKSDSASVFGFTNAGVSVGSNVGEQTKFIINSYMPFPGGVVQGPKSGYNNALCEMVYDEGIWSLDWRNDGKVELSCYNDNSFNPDYPDGFLYLETYPNGAGFQNARLARNPADKRVWVLNAAGLFKHIGKQKFERVIEKFEATADFLSGTINFNETPNLVGLQFSPSGKSFITYNTRAQHYEEWSCETGELLNYYNVPSTGTDTTYENIVPAPGTEDQLGVPQREKFKLVPYTGRIVSLDYYAMPPGLGEEFPTLGDIFANLSAAVGVPSDKLDLSLLDETHTVQGYAVTSRTTARSAIESVLLAYGVDVVESQGKLRLQPRSKAPYAGSISKADQEVVSDGQESKRTEIVRAQEFELPQTLEVSYSNPEQDYKEDIARSKRLNTSAKGTRNYPLPVVMSPKRASKTAEMLMATNWLARTALTFQVGRKWAFLEPGDVVDVETEAGFRRVILSKVKASPSGIVSCEGVLFDYSLVDGIQDIPVGQLPDRSLSVVENPALLLLDIPLLKTGDDGSGFYAAAYPLPRTKTKRSVVLLESADTYELGTDIGTNATVGVVTEHNLAGAPATTDADILDEEFYIEVRLDNGTLFNAGSDAEIWQGKRKVAYEYAQDRWAVASFRTAEVVDASVPLFRLRGLVLGQHGTDTDENGRRLSGFIPPMATARFVRLDGAVVRVTANLENTSSTFNVLCVAVGKTRESASPVPLAFRNEGLLPLSPLSIGERIDEDGTYGLSWLRRTRHPTSIRDGVDAPLAEATESYLVSVYDGSTLVFSSTTSNQYIELTPAQMGGWLVGQTRKVVVQQVSDKVGPGKPMVRLLTR